MADCLGIGFARLCWLVAETFPRILALSVYMNPFQDVKDEKRRKAFYDKLFEDEKDLLAFQVTMSKRYGIA